MQMTPSPRSGDAAPEELSVVPVEPGAAAQEPQLGGALRALGDGLLQWPAKGRTGSHNPHMLLAAVQGVAAAQLEGLQRLGLVQQLAGRRLHDTLPVYAVAMIMGTVYVSFAGVCMPAAGIAGHSMSSVVFHSTFSMSLISYLQGVSTDPGRIPENWRGDPNGVPLFAAKGEAVFEPYERKKSGGYRYCHKENIFKPDRAHYCSALSRNVLRMDHYCPWLMTCVGFRNHKFFFLFLMYTAVSANLASGHMIFALAHAKYPAMQTFMMAQGSVLCSLISATLTPFLSFHCWLLSKNMTTLEYCEKRRSHERGALSPYDRGLLANVRSVMGESWLLWPVPVGAPTGDGLTWELRPTPGALDRSTAGPGEAGLRILSNTAESVREIAGDLWSFICSRGAAAVVA